MGLTQAISNRVFRALDSLTTPIATFTPASRSVRTMLDSDSGGPGSLITRKDQDYERDDSIVLEKKGLHSSLLPKAGKRSR